jgi:hypothetical protein
MKTLPIIVVFLAIVVVWSMIVVHALRAPRASQASTPVVVYLDSREAAVVCTNGRPIISETSKIPNVVTVKCE